MSTIILNLTHNCNLSCKYCYYAEEMKKNSSDMGVETVREVMKKISRSSIDNIEFIFHGGEPLILGIDRLQLIIGLQKEYLDNKVYSNIIQTNCTIMDSDIIDFFQRNNFGIGVSIDGPKEIHDKYRRYKNGSGSYNTAINNFSKIQDRGVKVAILSVCSDEMYRHIDKLYSHIKQFRNVVTWDLLYAEINSSQNILTKGNYGEIMVELFNYWFYDEECHFKIKFLTAIIMNMLSLPYNLPCVFNYNCILNSKIFSIDINGNVFPCDSMTHICLGNIHDKNVEFCFSSNNLVKKYDMQQKNQICLFCEWFKYCSGGCPLTYEHNTNKSYYCSDFKNIFKYISEQLIKNKLIEKSSHPNYKSIKNIPNPVLRNICFKGLEVLNNIQKKI